MIKLRSWYLYAKNSDRNLRYKCLDPKVPIYVIFTPKRIPNLLPIYTTTNPGEFQQPCTPPLPRYRPNSNCVLSSVLLLRSWSCCMRRFLAGGLMVHRAVAIPFSLMRRKFAMGSCCLNKGRTCRNMESQN